MRANYRVERESYLHRIIDPKACIVLKKKLDKCNRQFVKGELVGECAREVVRIGWGGSGKSFQWAPLVSSLPSSYRHATRVRLWRRG